MNVVLFCLLGMGLAGWGSSERRGFSNGFITRGGGGGWQASEFLDEVSLFRPDPNPNPNPNWTAALYSAPLYATTQPTQSPPLRHGPGSSAEFPRIFRNRGVRGGGGMRGRAGAGTHRGVVHGIQQPLQGVSLLKLVELAWG